MSANHVRPNYVAVWGWLVILLMVGVAVAYLPFPKSITTFLIFAIAAVKAVMVALNYMHLRFERLLIYAIAIVPLLLFLILTVTLIPDIVFNR
jgi:caa(3)-type oxidase subunit IV